MLEGQWTQIFKAGDYGTKGSYSNDDLDKIVANFNSDDQVPIVIGHPKADSPAWGWLEKVKRAGDVLLAKPANVQPEFATAIASKQFKNRSVRIAKTDKGPKLMHLGYLGAVLPEVAGLKTAEFSQNQECTVVSTTDFGFELPFVKVPKAKKKNKKQEDNVTDKERIAKLEKDLANEKADHKKTKETGLSAANKARQAEFSTFVETHIQKGRLSAGKKDEVVAFMMTLPADDTADFSWSADEKTISGAICGWFKDFISNLPKADFLEELPEGEQHDFSSPAQGGKSVASHGDLAGQV